MQNYQYACMSPQRKVNDLTVEDDRLLDEDNERFKIRRVDPTSLVTSHEQSYEEQLNSQRSNETSPDPSRNVNSKSPPKNPN